MLHVQTDVLQFSACLPACLSWQKPDINMLLYMQVHSRSGNKSGFKVSVSRVISLDELQDTTLLVVMAVSMPSVGKQCETQHCGLT